MLDIKLFRYYGQDKDRTFGLISIDCEFECHTLEDEYRSVKVNGETRIPAGQYEVILNKKDTPLTNKYADKFPWFTYHLMLKDVPGFSNIYIHIGNFDENTEGCILVGEQPNYSANMITNSTDTFERFYKKVAKALYDGEKVFITIKDEGQWL